MSVQQFDQINSARQVFNEFVGAKLSTCHGVALGQYETLYAALVLCVDVMRRADSDYVTSHSVEMCTDKEWDLALQIAEDQLSLPEVL